MKKLLTYLAAVAIFASWNHTVHAYGNMPPATAQITASPSTIQPGQTVTLTWTTSGATGAAISGIGTVDTQGSIVVQPQATTVYTIYALNAAGVPTAAAATVTVQPLTNCPGNESFVTVQVVSASTDTVIGDLEDGGSSGWVVQPFQTANVTLAATSPNIKVNLQAYEQSGVPYPQNYHTLSVPCSGSFNYLGTCNSTWPSVGPTIASVLVNESSPGQFSCSVTSLTQ